MKNKIISAAYNAGIKAVGVCKARVYDELLPILEREATPMTADYEQRINPFLLMSEARSVIVCLFPYYIKDEKTNLSMYAKGADYHSVVKGYMHELEKVLFSEGYSAMSFADSGALPDRYLAYLAGLGFFGKNRALINPLYGSFVFIGYIITDADIKEDKPLEMKCMDCGKCIKSCPGGALTGDSFDAFSCASFITQKKGVLSKREEDIIKKSGYVWGCDICQSVCPHNARIQNTDISAFCDNRVDKLYTGMAESNREFKRKFKDRAFSWRGLDVIERNLEVLEEK